MARRPLARRDMPSRPIRDSGSEDDSAPETQIDRDDALLVAVASIWSDVLGVSFKPQVLTLLSLEAISTALRVCQKLCLLSYNCGDDMEGPTTSFAGEAMGSLGPLELLKRQRLESMSVFCVLLCQTGQDFRPLTGRVFRADLPWKRKSKLRGRNAKFMAEIGTVKVVLLRGFDFCTVP